VEIVLGEIGIAGGDQGQIHGAGVSHVGRGVEPVFEKEKCAEDEAGDLALAEKVYGQKKRDQPLQQRASPKAKRGAEPAKEIVPAFVDDQVGRVDEKKSAVGAEGVDQESDVEDQPGNDFRTRDGLPGLAGPELVEKGLQVFAHGQFDFRAAVRWGKVTNVRAWRVREGKSEVEFQIAEVGLQIENLNLNSAI